MPRNSPEKYPMLNQELTDWGVGSEDELVAADTYRGISEKKALNEFLGQMESVDPEMLEAFREEKDPLKKLEFLTKMSLGDAVDAVELSAGDERISSYLSNRLDFYNSLVEGTATRKAKGGESWYDESTGRYIYAEEGEEIKIDNSDITPETVSRGLFRDVCYAQMIGTPEMGIFKMAERRLKRQEIPTTHLPPLKGYHSGIERKTKEAEGNVGVAYPFLRKLYDRALESIRRKQEKKGESFSEEEFEHDAVLMATDWLEESMRYNPSDRGPESPYVGTPEEAIAWARLGGQVKAQLRGMRQKIQGVDLHNIARFIGRSGDTKHYSEYRRSQRRVDELKNVHDADKEGVLLRENKEAISRIKDDFEQGKVSSEQRDALMADILYRNPAEDEFFAELEKKYKKRVASLERRKKKKIGDSKQKDLHFDIDEWYENEKTKLESWKKERTQDLEKGVPRTFEQLVGDSESEAKPAKEKFDRKKSLAHKAIDLHFRLRQFEPDAYQPSIDWINNAPVGLIKWTHTALLRGVSEKTAFGYARASYIFPEAVVDRELIELASVLTPEDADNIREIAKINVDLGIEADPKELCKLSQYSPNVYKGLLEKGYTMDALASNTWLNDQSVVELPEGEEFPFAAKETQQRSWCVKHAFHAPDGWNQKRLGAIILRRLQMGVDKNLHDATYWLQEFEAPDEKNGTVYRDHAGEIELLHSLTDVPDDIRRRLPSKRNKYEVLFSEDATQLIYEAALPFAKEGAVEYEQIAAAVEAKLQEFEANPRSARSLKIPLPELKERIEACLQDLKQSIDSDAPFDPVPKIVGELKVVGNQRTDFINTAQKWVEAHSSAPRTLLTYAWANRELALAEGCDDNPRAIKQWADLNALRGAFDDMESRGQLPENITKEDILAYGDWLRELVRCYDGRAAIRTLSEIKSGYNPEYQLAPTRISLGNGVFGEVFAKNDPRGCTIGFDTGCCMTLGGASESCIRAGYEKPPYGFFALYRQDELVAQSFLYNNADTAPETIVCDNIEANQGRDKNKLLELYSEFFRRYLEEHLRRDSDPRFSRVNIGEGYSSVGLDGLKSVDSVHMPDGGIYTDAQRQRLLLEIGKEKAEKLKRYKAAVLTPEMWDDVKEAILKIEKGAFEGKGYTEDQLEQEFSNPDNIVVVIKDGEEVIGYSTSLPQDEDTLLVSSTALLPKYQGQGLVSDVMYSLDVEARSRGYEYYERTAAVDNGYADKLKRNYEVVEERKPTESPYGLQQYLKMRIPDHIPSSRLDAQKEIEKPKERVTFPNIVPEQAAIVADLEKEIYPPDLAQGEEDWREELEDDANEYETGNASFLIMEHGSGEPIPIGYAIAYMAESEMDDDESVVLYVRDVALKEDKQKKGYGRQALQRLVQFASGRQGMPIEFYARESTSYAALKNSSGDLEKLGYRIVSEELDEDHVGSGENFYLLRLERIEKEKIAA